MNKLIVAAVLAILGLSACVPEETTTTATAKPAQACTAEEQAGLTEAAAVLLERGFVQANGERILGSAAVKIGCPYDGPWLSAFNASAKNAGNSGYSNDIEYNIETGLLNDYSDPVAYVRSVPDCFRKGYAFNECRPNYHPMFGDPKLIDPSTEVCWPNPELKKNPQLRKQPGYQIHFPEEVCQTTPAVRACKLDNDWKKFCRHPEASSDGCWGFPKADIITGPPPRNVKSRIDLARATKAKEAKALAAAQKPRVLPGTVCEHLNWGPNQDWGIGSAG